MSELHDEARALLQYYNTYGFAGTDEDNIIARLLAENERLLTDLQQANVTTLKAINQRMDAEARLRALCEAEPVAYGFPDTAITGSGPTMMMLRHEVPADDQYQGAFWLPLIPRPSMEVSK